MEVLNLKIDEIKPYENNPRNNLDAVDATANSIKEFGWRQPIVVDKDKVIVAGHTRYYAAKKLGYDVVPVVDASDLSDEQVRAYRLADNKTGELANWAYSDLMAEIQENLGKMDYKVQYEDGYSLVFQGKFEKGLEKLLPLEEEENV